jgi:hypothetical protein
MEAEWLRNQFFWGMAPSYWVVVSWRSEANLWSYLQEETAMSEKDYAILTYKNGPADKT